MSDIHIEDTPLTEIWMPTLKSHVSAVAEHKALKKRHPDRLLFIRVGDFYELFYADAETVAAILGLTIVSASPKGKPPIPMVGFPSYLLQGYWERIRERGYLGFRCEPSDKGVVE